MYKIEEYIQNRKIEDNLDEFNLSKKSENTKLCIDYVFEYFNNYLSESEIEHDNKTEGSKVKKYKQEIEKYCKEVQEWLLAIYKKYNTHFNRIIINIIKQDCLFLLYNEESDLNKLSYNCYSKLIKKYPFLENDIDNLKLFIKDYYLIESTNDNYSEFININIDPIVKWIEKTKNKYNVNLYNFADRYLIKFSDDESLWDKKYEHDQLYHLYSYDLSKSRNLFNINYIYNKLGDRPFLKGKKNEMIGLLMFVYNLQIDGNFSDFVEKYLETHFSEK